MRWIDILPQEGCYFQIKKYIKGQELKKKVKEKKRQTKEAIQRVKNDIKSKVEWKRKQQM